MKKTRLGISIGLLGAGIYFASFFSGYLCAVLLAGYVLLFEENRWLRRSAVKAVVLLVFFSLLTAVLNLVPNTISVIDNVAGIFGAYFSLAALTELISALTGVLSILEKVLFILLGLKALKQGTVVIPPVDKLITTYME